jgi:5,10-methylenetetrahydromethanopterin reductase
MAALSFEVGLIPQRPVAELADLAVMAEELGFAGVWAADSQCVFRDAYALLTLCAARTRRMRLATGVTNPVTRHPAVIAASLATLDELSGGRAVLGLGVGESAVRTLGLRPATLSELEETIGALRSLWQRQPTHWRGREIRMTWPQRGVPVYLAASGPRSLQLAGRLADGVLFQVGSHPALVEYALKRIRRGAEQAGRPPGEPRRLIRLACMVGADGRWAREEIKSYTAAAAGTVFSAVPAEEMPPDLQSALATMKRQYDYFQHVAPQAPHKELVNDAILDAIAVAGTPAEVLPRLKAIAALGIDGFVLPITTSRPQEFLRIFAEQILPHFA